MNLYQLASQDEAWGAYALDDDTTPWTAWPADPPAPVPPGPVPLDAALDAAAREYGVNADVLRALGPGGSVDSIFDTAASLRSRLEAFGGDYAQALASYRQAEEGQGGIALAAPAAAPLSPPALADAQVPAPGPTPSARTAGPEPRPRPARPQAAARGPGAPPPQAARPDQPPAPPDGRRGAADDPRSLLYRPAPAAQRPLVDASRSQPGSGTDTASFAPVRPEVRQALGNAWDAASPGERQRMQSTPGWQGQVARERAAQYAQADKGVLAASPTAALLDGRAENRAKAPPAASAAPRAGGNGRAQPPTARPTAVPAVAAERAPLPQRGWGEAISDATKSAAQGILDVASLPGVAYSAITGDYDTAYLNAIRGTQEVLQDEKSPALQAQAQALQQKLATAEGWREKLAVGGWETLKNPTLLGDTLARSAPGMLAGGVLGRAAGGAADTAGTALLGRTIATGSEAAAKSAVALKNAAPAIASGTAVGAAAAQQGASVANDLYAELRKLPASAFAAEPEFQQLAREHGEGKARDILAAAATTRALLVGTGASVLSMRLVPGGDAIEKAFLPSHLKGGAAREAVKSSSFLTQPLTRGMQGNLGTQALEIAVQGLKHGTTGSLSEGGEEASGAVAKGLELSRAGQDVKLSDMAGEAAGQGMAAGFAMDGAAGTRGTKAAPRVQNQPIQPGTPPASPPPPAPTMAQGQTAPAAPNASGLAVHPLPSPAATLAAALLPGYPQALQPDSVPTWSNTASATRKAQTEAEILRQAKALPAQEAATATTTAPSPAAPSATPAGPLPASTDGNHSGTQQGADALPQRQVSSDADQAGTATQATATDPANTPVPTASVAGAQADANAATDTAPTTTQHGTARHTAAAQVQPPAPAPIEAQIQALDSGMLVVGGDQATILAHLHAGGVRGAEPFMGTTIVPVDQAALAQQVLSRPLAAATVPVDTQAGRGSQRGSATATLPGTKTAAQLAPAATQASTAGGSTAGPSPVGASAPRTEGRHGSPTNVANAGSSHPVPVMEMQRDGTLMVKGDPVQLQERLRQGGVERVLRRKGGVLVGLDQVGKARQLLQQPPRAQASAGPSPTGQQYSRRAPPLPDRPSRARGLPSKPATVKSVRAAVARLTNSMGLLANGLGRVVVATSADIQAHWEPLVGEVDMGSQDTGLAQGFFDPNTNTVFLIADHIEAGQEMAVAAHELVHKHGKAVLGEAGWKQLHEVIGSWANRPEGSLERQVCDEAAARVQASRPAGADETSYSSEELFPYAVQVAMELGVQPTALMPNNSVQGWLARVRASLKDVLGKLTGNPQAFDGQDLVDLAFAMAQREGAERAQDTNARFHEGSQRTGLLFSRALNQYMREAATFGEARAAAKEFQGRPLTNALTGLQAHVSRNSLDKMLSSKAVEKSVSARAQSFAVANLDKLYQAAAYGWSKSDRDANSNIKAIHRFFVPMALNDRLLIAKLTVKETVDENHANPLYTVETVDFNEKSPAAQWVDASAKADGIDLTSIRSAGEVLSLAQEVEQRNARGDAAGDATLRFSTRSNGQDPGLSLEQVQELVQQALSGLSNPPPVDIVGRSEEAWVEAPEGVMGAALPEEGRIVIVASAHRNADAVLETLFHEMSIWESAMYCRPAIMCSPCWTWQNATDGCSNTRLNGRRKRRMLRINCACCVRGASPEPS